MGLLDFVKEAGAKLMGGGEPEAAKPQVAAATRSPEEIRELNDRRRAMGLAQAVEKMGFEVDELGIRVNGDVATVTGSVADQATRERVILAVGNTAGIAQVDDQMEAVAPAAAATLHTVVRGDTLGGIAKTYYGNAMKYPVIFEANKPMLSNPDKIYPGQVLRIPPLD